MELEKIRKFFGAQSGAAFTLFFFLFPEKERKLCLKKRTNIIFGALFLQAINFLSCSVSKMFFLSLRATKTGGKRKKEVLQSDKLS